MDKKKVLRFAFAACLALCIALILMFIIGWREYNGEITEIDFSQVKLMQTDTINLNIKDDAKVAVIDTDEGRMMAELYTDTAPNTTGNFISLAESGYYDGTYIYEARKSTDEETSTESRLYFSGGSTYSDGSVDESHGKKTEKIETEFSQDLWPFKGSFMSCGYARPSLLLDRKLVYGGSRFMVCGSIDFNENIREEMLKDEAARNVSQAFIDYGGLPNASQTMTIFAQTFYGWDTVEKLLSVKTDTEKYHPYDEIKINKVQICTYADVKEEVESAGPEKKFALNQLK